MHVSIRKGRCSRHSLQEKVEALGVRGGVLGRILHPRNQRVRERETPRRRATVVRERTGGIIGLVGDPRLSSDNQLPINAEGAHHGSSENPHNEAEMSVEPQVHSVQEMQPLADAEAVQAGPTVPQGTTTDGMVAEGGAVTEGMVTQFGRSSVMPDRLLLQTPTRRPQTSTRRPGIRRSGRHQTRAQGRTRRLSSVPSVLLHELPLGSSLSTVIPVVNAIMSRLDGIASNIATMQSDIATLKGDTATR